jgi:hypothetical protein
MELFPRFAPREYRLPFARQPNASEQERYQQRRQRNLCQLTAAVEHVLLSVPV